MILSWAVNFLKHLYGMHRISLLHLRWLLRVLAMGWSRFKLSWYSKCWGISYNHRACYWTVPTHLISDHWNRPFRTRNCSRWNTCIYILAIFIVLRRWSKQETTRLSLTLYLDPQRLDILRITLVFQLLVISFVFV